MSGKAVRTLAVTRPGYTLHAEAISSSRPEAPWVVFSNSLVTDLSIWDAQAAALAGEYGVLRYDQAGHGRSGLPAHQIGFDDLGADLLAVMDAAEVQQAVFVGLSMGVPTGLAAHRLAADRFSGIVLCDGQARTAPGGAAGWAERIEGARNAGMAPFAAATAARWLTDTTAPEIHQRLEAMIGATSFDGFTLCATALMDYDYATELAQINCPTLLIAGAQDGAMPDSMAKNLKAAIAGAEMTLIPDAGHVPCFEQPAAFTATLTAFLSRLPSHT